MTWTKRTGRTQHSKGGSRHRDLGKITPLQVIPSLEKGDGRLADNCQILAVRSDICKIGQLSDRTTVSADNCQIGQLSDRTAVRSDNCQIGQLSVGQLSVDHGQLSEETVSALKKL